MALHIALPKTPMIEAMPSDALKSKAITAHVTQDFYEAFNDAARDAKRSAGELAREVLERHIAHEPWEVAMLAEVWQTQSLLLFLFGMLAKGQPITDAIITQEIIKTDAEKRAAARNELQKVTR